MLYGIMSALPMLVCLFWTTTLLLKGSWHAGRAKRTLTLFMGVATVLYFCHWIYFNKIYEALPFTDTLYSLCMLSAYPFYYLYINMLTERSGLTTLDLCSFIPSVVFCAACGVIYALMEGPERTEYLQYAAYGQGHEIELSPLGRAQNLHVKIARSVIVAQATYALWSGNRKIARYEREVRNYYSNTEGKTYCDIGTMLVFFTITSLSSSVMSIIGKDHFADSTWLIIVPSMHFSVLLYMLGYIGAHHNFTIEDFVNDEKEADTTEWALGERPVFAQDYGQRKEALKTQLLHLLEHEELFRNSNLRVSDVAARMCSNREYVSRIVNQDLNSSFCDLINSYRVEYAKKLLKEAHTSTISVTEVSEMSGFSSESSFYRIFKNNTGMPPKVWCSKHRADEAI